MGYRTVVSLDKLGGLGLAYTPEEAKQMALDKLDAHIQRLRSDLQAAKDRFAEIDAMCVEGADAEGDDA